MYKDSEKKCGPKLRVGTPHMGNSWKALKLAIYYSTEKLIKMLTNFSHTMGSGGSKRGTGYGCFPSGSKLFHFHAVFSNNLAKNRWLHPSLQLAPSYNLNVFPNTLLYSKLITVEM